MRVRTKRPQEFAHPNFSSATKLLCDFRPDLVAVGFVVRRDGSLVARQGPELGQPVHRPPVAGAPEDRNEPQPTLFGLPANPLDQLCEPRIVQLGEEVGTKEEQYPIGSRCDFFNGLSDRSPWKNFIKGPDTHRIASRD